MSDGSERSGISPWLVGLIGYGLYRRGQRHGRAATDAGAGSPMRQIRLPDGRDALQVTVSMFEPDQGSPELWRRVALEGAAEAQDALELTVVEVTREGVDASTGDVPMVLLPLGTRRRVQSVDVHATGGLVGRLPDAAVRAVGESLRRTQLAIGRPCAVPGRIHRDGPSGARSAEVLLPEGFRPGASG